LYYIFTPKSYVTTISFSILLSIISIGIASADDNNRFPKVSGSISFELQNDFAFASDDTAEEFNNLFTTIEPQLKLSLTDKVSINSGLVFEQVQAPATDGDNQTFAGHGAYVEVLTLDFQDETTHLSVGKMHVNFGKAWDIAPGIFGTDLAAEYEMAENLGLLAAYSQDFGSVGRHTLSTQSFMLDTSGLAESAFARRKKTRESAGGPGNTGDFSSFAISVDGGEFQFAPGLHYHAAFVHNANDTAGAKDEQRIALGGSYDFSLPGEIGVTPMIEYVKFNDADGTTDQDRDYLTLALGVSYQAWNAAISGTFKENEMQSGAETREELLQMSAGYAFSSGIGLDVAYKRTRNAGIDTNVFGTLLTYGYEF